MIQIEKYAWKLIIKCKFDMLERIAVQHLNEPIVTEKVKSIQIIRKWLQFECKFLVIPWKIRVIWNAPFAATVDNNRIVIMQMHGLILIYWHFKC